MVRITIRGYLGWFVVKHLIELDFLEQRNGEDLEDFVEGFFEAQGFFDNGDKNVDAERNPDLCFDGVS